MNKKRGLMLVLITALISGFSIFFNKFGVSGIDSGLFAFSKNLITAIFLISVIFLFNQFSELKNLKLNQWIKLITIGLIGGSIPFLLFFKGLQFTSGVSAAFIHKLMFIFVIIFAFIFLKEKISKNLAVGGFMLLIGISLLLKFSLNQTFFNYGSLLILVATLLWAIENTLSKHVLKEVPPNLVAFGRMFFGSLFILIYLLVSNQFSLIFNIPYNQFFWVIFTSVFLFMYVFTWYNGLKYVNVSVASCILILGSIVTSILHLIFSDAILTLSQCMGIIFILAGIIFVIGISNSMHLIKDILRWKTTN